jgi:hypothetical protein
MEQSEESCVCESSILFETPRRVSFRHFSPSLDSGPELPLGNFLVCGSIRESDASQLQVSRTRAVEDATESLERPVQRRLVARNPQTSDT